MRSYVISQAKATGGKAGKGCNKTSSIQIFDDTDPFCCFIVKIFRYNVGDDTSKLKAITRARNWISAKKYPAPANSQEVEK